MDCERALRLLRLPRLPQGAQLVKSTWLSLCLQERRLVDTAGFSIYIPNSLALMMKPVMGKRTRLAQLIWKPLSVATTPHPLREMMNQAQPLRAWISGSVHSLRARRQLTTTPTSQRSWKCWPKPTMFRETSGGPWAMPRPSMPSRASTSLSPPTRKPSVSPGLESGWPRKS
uniref:DNA polymerase lambda n=2 Tax=Felinae TaxID=338152 RepID=A0ABI7X2Z9_FELCA